MSAVRVVLVDDHSVVTDGVEAMLARFEDIEVVGTANGGRAGIDLCDRLQPDVVLMDLSMPEMSGVEATRQIMELQPETRVIALTGFVEEDMVRDVIAAGASGYLLKTVAGDDLADAVRRTARGQASVSLEALRHMPSGDEELRPRFQLTPREHDVLACLARGMTNKAIARELSLSPSTIRVYVSTILHKLGVDNRTAAASLALREGLVSAAPSDSATPSAAGSYDPRPGAPA